jgi:type I site-specific restriction endonuclease
MKPKRITHELVPGAILVASSGTLSTGVNIKRIHNIIFTSPTKSMIRVIQSIGRGLRTASDKTHVKLFDMADDLRVGKHENHTWKHFGERLKIYSEEQFEYSIVEVNLE